MSFDVDGYTLEPGSGEHLWSFNCLMSVKAGGSQTHEAFTVVELICPPSFGPPPHVHQDEDEAWYILEGEVSFACGDKRSTANVGSFVLAPRAIEHTFMTWDQGPVRMLQITSPARFERFAAEMGRAAEEPVLPDPAPFDDAFVQKLLSVAPRYGLEFRLGPPPQ